MAIDREKNSDEKQVTSYKGVGIDSRYGNFHEQKTVRDALELLPTSFLEAIREVFIDSKASADYTVRLKSPHYFFSVGKHFASAICHVAGGYNYIKIENPDGSESEGFECVWEELPEEKV